MDYIYLTIKVVYSLRIRISSLNDPPFSLPNKLVMERKLSVTLTWARGGGDRCFNAAPIFFSTDLAVIFGELSLSPLTRPIDHIKILEISEHYFLSAPPENKVFW